MRFRRRFFVGVGGALLVAAAFVALGERRMPTGPDGWESDRQEAEEGGLPAEFVVATFNIHGCVGRGGREDAGQVAKCLEGVDLAGLQEVHGLAWAEPRDQAALVAELCRRGKENSVFAPAETQWFGVKRFGNGLIAESRLLSWQRLPLPRRYDRSCRNMLVADAAVAGGTIRVLVTHVERSCEREREIQLASVFRLFGSLEPPAILLADLNTAPGDPRIQSYLAGSDAIDAIKEGGLGDDRVDWILVRGLQCLESKRIDNGVSDHPMYTARLRWRGSEERDAAGRSGRDGSFVPQADRIGL